MLIFFTVLWQHPMRFAILSIDMSVDESSDTTLPTSAVDSAHPVLCHNSTPDVDRSGKGGSRQCEDAVKFSPNSVK